MNDDSISREALRRRMYHEAFESLLGCLSQKHIMRKRTMARYIDAIEAAAAIKDFFADMPRIEFMGNRRRWREENEQYLRCLDVLRSLPTADVRENVHAHWDKVEVKSGEWWHTCSKCKATLGSEDGELDFNFCPNCGARMDERREDE